MTFKRHNRLAQLSKMTFPHLQESRLLSRRKALGHLGEIGEALRELEQEAVPPQATDVPDGNVLKRVLEVGDSGSDFSIRCVMHLDPTQPLSEARAADLAELRNSAQIIIEEVGDARGFAHHLKVGEMMVRNTKTRGPGMFYKAEERISREFLLILRDWSVEDIEQDMEAAFAGHFEERRHVEEGTSPDAMRQEATPTIDLELAERRARLELVTRDLTEKALDTRGSARLVGMVQDTFPGRMPTIGAHFKHCPESVLRGTGANLKMKGGNVMRSDDLLIRLLLSLCAVPEQYRFWIQLNPLTFIIEQAREVLIWGHLPDFVGLAVYSFVALGVAWFGYAWFQFTRRGFADVL